MKTTQQAPDRNELPLATRVRSFVIAVAGLVAIIYLAQYPIRLIPAFNTYSEVVDKNDFNPGALYYTDVHVTADSAEFVKMAIDRAMTEPEKYRKRAPSPER